MSKSVVDESFTLAELLDVEGFREVCKSFSELFGIGIKVFDAEGNKITDVRASTGDHCGYLFTVHPTQVACTNLVNRIRTVEINASSPPTTVDCFSGLRYRIIPVVYEGSLLGRFIFGPFAPAGLSEPPAALKQYEPALNRATLAGYLSKIPRASEETVDKVVNHVDKILDVIIHSSHRTLVTSRLHIASIQGAFDDLEKANRSLREANGKLQELDRLKSNFIATVSHELRTPLTSVIGYSEMLLEGMAGELTPEQREYVTTILEKGESLLNLIGQVLDLSRIESGNVIMHLEPTDARDLMKLAITDVLPQAQKRDIRLSTEVAREVTPIVVDGDKIRRVLTNLLGNAVKFSSPGGTVRVAVDLYTVPPEEKDLYDRFEPDRNRYLRLRVIDSGIGIPEDKLEQIFEAFYQVDNSSTREFGGTGLGLSIVRNFVSAHHGRINVDSRLGAGSTFTVLLPYVADAIEKVQNVEIRSSSPAA